MIAKQGLLGIAAQTRFPMWHPGEQPELFGTNPISFAAPSGSGNPVVLDMATSAVARGKISVAAEKGEPIP